MPDLPGTIIARALLAGSVHEALDLLISHLREISEFDSVSLYSELDLLAHELEGYPDA